jgi:hypothetical protein
MQFARQEGRRARFADARKRMAIGNGVMDRSVAQGPYSQIWAIGRNRIVEEGLSPWALFEGKKRRVMDERERKARKSFFHLECLYTSE